MESGQLERWYFHLGASNGISVPSFLIHPLHPMLFIPDSVRIYFFHVETHKGSTSMWGGLKFYYTSHDMNRFIPHVHRARPLNGFENGPNLAKNRVEYVLLIA